MHVNKNGLKKSIRICYWGTFERNYPRNQIVIKGLMKNGIEVIICHEPFWEKTGDKTKGYKGNLRKVLLVIQFMWAYLKLFVRYLCQPHHDIIFVGYLGQFDMPLAACLGFFFRRPVVFDAFLSIYDSSVMDRKVVAMGSFFAWFLKQADTWACRLADRVILDTQCHIDYFHEEFRIPRKKMITLPIGADDDVFKPKNRESDPPLSGYTILHYGKYTPLHGIPYILEAAKILQQKDFSGQFVFIGDGQLWDEMVELSKRLELQNVSFIKWMEPLELSRMISVSDLCLGIFGETEKAHRVVPNKVYECMAMARPVITGSSPASKSLLQDRQNVYMCDMANGESLANAILDIYRHPEIAKKLEHNAYESYLKSFCPEELGKAMAKELEILIQ